VNEAGSEIFYERAGFSKINKGDTVDRRRIITMEDVKKKLIAVKLIEG